MGWRGVSPGREEGGGEVEELEQEAVMKSVSLLGGLTWMSLSRDADARTDGRTSTSPSPADRCDSGVRSGRWICRWRP